MISNLTICLRAQTWRTEITYREGGCWSTSSLPAVLPLQPSEASLEKTQCLLHQIQTRFSPLTSPEVPFLASVWSHGLACLPSSSRGWKSLKPSAGFSKINKALGWSGAVCHSPFSSLQSEKQWFSSLLITITQTSPKCCSGKSQFFWTTPLHLRRPLYYTIEVKIQTQLEGPENTDCGCKVTAHRGTGL